MSVASETDKMPGGYFWTEVSKLKFINSQSQTVRVIAFEIEEINTNNTKWTRGFRHYKNIRKKFFHIFQKVL